MLWLNDADGLRGLCFHQEDWVCEEPIQIPKQTNGFDCCIFILAYCDFIARGLLDLNCFSQTDMSTFRTNFKRHIEQGIID